MKIAPSINRVMVSVNLLKSLRFRTPVIKITREVIESIAPIMSKSDLWSVVSNFFMFLVIWHKLYLVKIYF